MEDTQSFHLIETMDTMEITLNHVDGQNIVYWKDIEQVFPGVKRVRNGKSVIKFLRRSDQQSINHCSQLVLDVVLSTSVQPVLDYQVFAKAIKDGPGELGRAELRQELSEHFQKMEAMVVKNSELQEAMYAKQEEVVRLQEQALSNQEEMKQLQQRALGQLAMLHSRVQAVLTQTYELHEYSIPRLFVVLPQDPSGWDAVNPFSNKFRLYFLCECGEHTKSMSSKSKISHDIHFAKHEGYEIVRPSEFFQQYGPYVLTILKMLKFGVSVAGVAVPAISHLVRSDAIDQAITGLRQLRDNLESGMDHVIDWMDKGSANEGEAVDEFALEGADLRKLDTFLKNKDGNRVLGNLYRTVTDEGHVKWVCIDHYRVNYQRSSTQEFLRALDSVGGSFNENLGRVE
ncbi:hypothetical protein BGZ97_009159, partial [Linnemannia gamsii]